MVTFVLGFAFNNKLTDVVLITKNRPDFLAGKLNGLGGKAEPTDRSFRVTMHREALEEANLHTNWKFCTIARFDGNTCYIFYAIATNKQLRAVRTLTDEPINIYELSKLDEQPVDIDAGKLLARTLQYARQERAAIWRTKRAQKLQRRK